MKTLKHLWPILLLALALSLPEFISAQMAPVPVAGARQYAVQFLPTATPTPTPTPSPTPSPTPTPTPTPSPTPTAGALTVSASPISVFGSGVYSATTNSTTCSASGGIPPYTYSWTTYSGVQMGINGNQTATATVTYGGGAGVYNSVIICNVTDAASNKGSANVSVTISLSL